MSATKKISPWARLKAENAAQAEIIKRYYISARSAKERIGERMGVNPYNLLEDHEERMTAKTYEALRQIIIGLFLHPTDQSKLRWERKIAKQAFGSDVFSSLKT